MFYGFRSLCTKPQLCIISSLSRTYRPIVTIVSSLNFLLKFTKSRSKSISYLGMTMKFSFLSSKYPLTNSFGKSAAKIFKIGYTWNVFLYEEKCYTYLERHPSFLWPSLPQLRFRTNALSPHFYHRSTEQNEKFSKYKIPEEKINDNDLQIW